MKIHELLQNYVNNKDKGLHERRVGAYYASEVYAISKGYITPQNLFAERIIDVAGSENIAGGVAYENYLRELLEWNGADCSYQDKKYIPINSEITLAVKPDFLFSDMLWETKYPDSPMKDEVPDKWAFQLECEYRAFERKVYLGIFRRHPFLTLVEYNPSTLRWKNIQKIIVDFHEKLKHENNHKND